MSESIYMLLARRQMLLKEIRPEGERSSVLAEAHPMEQDAEAIRLRTAQSQGAMPGPRRSEANTIDIALDPRTRAILHYQMSPEERAELEGKSSNKGRKPT